MLKRLGERLRRPSKLEIWGDTHPVGYSFVVMCICGTFVFPLVAWDHYNGISTARAIREAVAVMVPVCALTIIGHFYRLRRQR